MFKAKLLLLLLLLLTILLVFGGVKGYEEDKNPYIFSSNRFPNDNDQQKPTLSNGHVGFTVFDDTVYMNGLYNGHLGLSHRARIPNWANIQLEHYQQQNDHFQNLTTMTTTTTTTTTTTSSTSTSKNNKIQQKYQLNVKTGIFKIRTINKDRRYMIIHLIYPHRYYNRAIINQMTIYRLGNSSSDIKIRLFQMAGNTSNDITFNQQNNKTNVIKINNQSVYSQCGYTNEVEDSNIDNNNNNNDYYNDHDRFPQQQQSQEKLNQQPKQQKYHRHHYHHHHHSRRHRSGRRHYRRRYYNNNTTKQYQESRNHNQHVCVLWNHVPEEITLKKGMHVMSLRFVMTVDGVLSVAKQEMMDVMSVNSNQHLVDMHTKEWTQSFWSTFEITVLGNFELSKAIYASIFYLVSSLPSLNTNIPSNMFYGLSPTGLPRGGTILSDYEGHSMWDTEIWMLPSILLMNPKWSEEILHYRYSKLNNAIKFANESGYPGARFPWESGYTGRDVTQPCCPLVASNQLHITADIAFAIRNHFSATNNLKWLMNEGCRLTNQIATFWSNRVQFNSSTQLYELRDIMGPDEDHESISNNVYTNIIVGYALYFGDFANCLCHQQKNQSSFFLLSNWSSIGKHLTLNYNKTFDYNPQYEGYNLGTPIKQADTILMGYPLNYPGLSKTTQKNNLKFYENVTRSSGPAMTWSMHTINHLQLLLLNDSNANELNKITELFRKSYENYIRKPFMVWNELIENDDDDDDVGAINFLTGAGGFLQTILNGYAGIKLKIGWLEISNPRLPPNTTQLIINGFQYLGSLFKLVIQSSNDIRLSCRQLNQQKPLKMVMENVTTHKLLQVVIIKEFKTYAIPSDKNLAVSLSHVAENVGQLAIAVTKSNEILKPILEQQLENNTILKTAIEK